MDKINNVATYGYAVPSYEIGPPSLRRRSIKDQAQTTSKALSVGRTRAIAEAADTSKTPDEQVLDIARAVELWGDTVFRLALCKTQNLFDAEDVVQTVFMKLCQSNPAFESDEHRKAWLLLVTLRCSIDTQRDPWEQRRIKSDATEAINQMAILRDDLPFCDSEATQRKVLVEEAVASLPEKQRIAVHLHYFEDYSTQEISQITGEKASTVRSHLHRARTALKPLIGGINE